MSPEGIGVAIALLVITALWVAAPLLNRELRSANQLTTVQRQRLAAHYERVLTNIRDLDEDFGLHKLDEEVYRAERERWIERGIQILVEIDNSGLKVDTPRQTNAEIDKSVDDEIERAVSAYRKNAKA